MESSDLVDNTWEIFDIKLEKPKPFQQLCVVMNFLNDSVP